MHDKDKQVIVHFCGTFALVVIIASFMHALEYDNELAGANDYERATNEASHIFEAADETYKLYCGSSAKSCAPSASSLGAMKSFWDNQVATKFAQSDVVSNGGSTIDVLNFADGDGVKQCVGNTKGCLTANKLIYWHLACK